MWLGTTPDALAANNGQGTDHFFRAFGCAAAEGSRPQHRSQNLRCRCVCCGSLDAHKHLGNDLLAGAWGLAAFLGAGVL